MFVGNSIVRTRDHVAIDRLFTVGNHASVSVTCSRYIAAYSGVGSISSVSCQT